MFEAVAAGLETVGAVQQAAQPDVWTLMMALGIAGALITILLTCLGVVLWFMARSALGKIDGLVQQLADMRADLPDRYVDRKTFQAFDARTSDSIKELGRDLKDGLERIWSKMDGKQDKP